MNRPATERGEEVSLAIRVRGLRNAFGDQVVHDNLDLDVRRGEIVGVVGGSGTGKSVLMRAILNLRRPQAGSIEVLGLNPCPRTSRPGWRWSAIPASCTKTERCFPR